ncbi:hypothetical protein CYLTODRAFT_484590 [Cylindrobasidium torrendii FP15055 ss-10]|uniref:Uncharacterized protein n=1 Tax=Cylindrobasidium torrendii FP15055 ss-10 TaxID=1314674 RepID=A0A0D7BVR2_9AGAR|nr:hypothetical protein CYLTODRAFT_484590 [Cylindrobasidium torrendii FP15055 ss-10]
MRFALFAVLATVASAYATPLDVGGRSAEEEVRQVKTSTWKDRRGDRPPPSWKERRSDHPPPSWKERRSHSSPSWKDERSAEENA